MLQTRVYIETDAWFLFSPDLLPPLLLIVASSWVSFWLVKTPAGGEIVARVGLGITCCLGKLTDIIIMYIGSPFTICI